MNQQEILSTLDGLAREASTLAGKIDRVYKNLGDLLQSEGQITDQPEAEEGQIALLRRLAARQLKAWTIAREMDLPAHRVRSIAAENNITLSKTRLRMTQEAVREFADLLDRAPIHEYDAATIIGCSPETLGKIVRGEYVNPRLKISRVLQLRIEAAAGNYILND